MAEKVSISVRNLVEFILNAGDIDNTRGYRDPDAMQEGTRIHRKIQKSMPEGYAAEVPLKTEIALCRDETGKISCSFFQREEAAAEGAKKDPEFVLMVEGRADGVWKQESAEPDVWIDEIKSMYQNVKLFEQPEHIHLAQAKCYACFYAVQNGAETVGVQMTYCSIETEEIKCFLFSYTTEELAEWFLGVVKEYAKWIFLEADWKKKRNESIRAAEFPFDYRPGQKEFVVGAYRSILREKKLFALAPTGVGKTISTIFPAVKAMGEELTSHIFYLTAKTIARTVAEDTFSLLSERGLKFRFVTITSKEKLCILEKPECNPAACQRAKGHFDRINEAVFELLNKEENVTRELLEHYAQKYNVCPFELCLDTAVWADAVICDYNYVFDPNVALKRFFAEDKKRDFVFLIDEAHNLLERAREMYSAELIKEDFLSVKKILKGKNKKIEKELDTCNSALLRLKRECEEFQVWDNIGNFMIPLMRLAAEFEEFLREQVLDAAGKEQVLNLYFAVRRFIEVHDLLGDEYRIFTDYKENGDFRLKLLCMEPAGQLKERMEKGRSTILFSATMLPMNYYKEQLGGAEEDYAIYVPSPFETEKRLLMVGRDVSTKYTRRTDREFEKIACYLERFTSAKTGNYFVFFPSYQMLMRTAETVKSLFAWEETEQSPVRLYLQKAAMTEKEKEEFLAAFSEQPIKTTIGFCVMGGIFGEGIDLKKDRLIGAVVVGTGLPMVCNEKELFRFYFDEKNGKGFEYAYLYPGMNKVMQSAGRVIRTTEDTGAILLLDERFLTPVYKKLFPKEWIPFETVTVSDTEEKVQQFWKKENRAEG